jgi:hypothetical protein
MAGQIKFVEKHRQVAVSKTTYFLLPFFSLSPFFRVLLAN